MKARRGASKIIPWMGLAVVLAAVGGLIWFSAWVTGYLHSEAFRRLAAAKTGDALHASVNFGPFRWTGSSVFVEECDATGAENSVIGSLAASELRADMNWRSLLHGVWRIERIEMLRLNASFLPAEAGKIPPSAPPATPAPSGLAGLLPQKFEVGEVAAASANLKFPLPTGNEFLTAEETRLVARSDSGGWEFSGGGGTLAVPVVGTLGITDYRVRLQGDEVFIGDSHFSVGSAGKLSLFGQWGTDSRLNLSWSQVDVAQILPPDWKTRISGALGGSCIFQPAGNGSDNGSWKASGEFKLTGGRLESFPLLDRLASFSSSPEFAHLPLDEVSGKFDRSPAGLVVTDFLLESKGFLRVESDRVVADGKLSGTFRVGVGAPALRWLPGDRIFSAPRDGYLWTEMKVDGTPQDPREDLSARLTAAIEEAAVRKASDFLGTPPALPAPAEKILNNLLNPSP